MHQQEHETSLYIKCRIGGEWLSKHRLVTLRADLLLVSSGPNKEKPTHAIAMRTAEVNSVGKTITVKPAHGAILTFFLDREDEATIWNSALVSAQGFTEEVDGKPLCVISHLSAIHSRRDDLEKLLGEKSRALAESEERAEAVLLESQRTPRSTSKNATSRHQDLETQVAECNRLLVETEQRVEDARAENKRIELEKEDLRSRLPSADDTNVEVEELRSKLEATERRLEAAEQHGLAAERRAEEAIVAQKREKLLKDKLALQLQDAGEIAGARAEELAEVENPFEIAQTLAESAALENQLTTVEKEKLQSRLQAEEGVEADMRKSLAVAEARAEEYAVENINASKDKISCIARGGTFYPKGFTSLQLEVLALEELINNIHDCMKSKN